MFDKIVSVFKNKKIEWYEPVDLTLREQCPCCDYISLADRGNYLICPICFWESDGQDVDKFGENSVPNHGVTLSQQPKGDATILKLLKNKSYGAIINNRRLLLGIVFLATFIFSGCVSQKNNSYTQYDMESQLISNWLSSLIGKEERYIMNIFAGKDWLKSVVGKDYRYNILGVSDGIKMRRDIRGFGKDRGLHQDFYFRPSSVSLVYKKPELYYRTDIVKLASLSIDPYSTTIPHSVFKEELGELNKINIEIKKLAKWLDSFLGKDKEYILNVFNGKTPEEQRFGYRKKNLSLIYETQYYIARFYFEDGKVEVAGLQFIRVN